MNKLHNFSNVQNVFYKRLVDPWTKLNAHILRQAAVQPGSMDSEAGIFSMTFDQSGSRLITTEADKTIKIYREDDTASEETHPINWRPEILKRRKF